MKIKLELTCSKFAAGHDTWDPVQILEVIT